MVTSGKEKDSNWHKSKHNDGIEQIITGNYGNKVHFRSIKARKERRYFKILKYASDSNFYLIYCVGLYYAVKISTKATLRQNLASTAVKGRWRTGINTRGGKEWTSLYNIWFKSHMSNSKWVTNRVENMKARIVRKDEWRKETKTTAFVIWLQSMLNNILF